MYEKVVLKKLTELYNMFIVTKADRATWPPIMTFNLSIELAWPACLAEQITWEIFQL